VSVDSVRVFGAFVYQALTLARSSIATAAGMGADEGAGAVSN